MLERKVGMEGWRCRLEGKVGMEGWNGRLEVKVGMEGWNGRMEMQVRRFVRIWFFLFGPENVTVFSAAGCTR